MGFLPRGKKKKKRQNCSARFLPLSQSKLSKLQVQLSHQLGECVTWSKKNQYRPTKLGEQTSSSWQRPSYTTVQCKNCFILFSILSHLLSG